jgi:hypothetical protein
MASVRKNHTSEFKAKVAIEAIRQQKTTNELTAEYSVHATLNAHFVFGCDYCPFCENPRSPLTAHYILLQN